MLCPSGLSTASLQHDSRLERERVFTANAAVRCTASYAEDTKRLPKAYCASILCAAQSPPPPLGGISSDPEKRPLIQSTSYAPYAMLL